MLTLRQSNLTIKSIKSLIPLMDRVLVKRIEPLSKTASGLFIPTSSTSTPPEAEVLAVGEGYRDKEGKITPTTVKAGDKVLLPSFGGQSFKLGEQEYQIFRDSEIIAKINE
ncbi:chaperonin Cpn10 [Atractiella rhizophila]|nr:chaperonin Cpn10 [Atractiella rhizophila]KAH8915831.1 chaperonin Cpn10 [Atractiella rhizophila]